jgi:hypothetical protein
MSEEKYLVVICSLVERRTFLYEMLFLSCLQPDVQVSEKPTLHLLSSMISSIE